MHPEIELSVARNWTAFLSLSVLLLICKEHQYAGVQRGGWWTGASAFAHVGFHMENRGAALSGPPSAPHYVGSIEVISFCTQPLCWVIYSTLSIWLLSKQSNSTTNPLIFTSLQRDPEGKTATTMHEWQVPQLQPLIQGCLFHLLDDMWCQLLINHHSTCEEPWICTSKPTRKALTLTHNQKCEPCRFHQAAEEKVYIIWGAPRCDSWTHRRAWAI